MDGFRCQGVGLSYTDSGDNLVLYHKHPSQGLFTVLLCAGPLHPCMRLGRYMRYMCTDVAAQHGINLTGDLIQIENFTPGTHSHSDDQD